MLETPPHYRMLPGFLTQGEQTFLLELAARATGWHDGRQGGGYQKLPLAGRQAGWLEELTRRCLQVCATPGLLGWDRYLLNYPPGSGVPGHRDPPLQGSALHVRLNAVVRQRGPGDRLLLAGQPITLAERDALVFRPDLLEHEVRAAPHERLLWSFGCNLGSPEET